MKSDVAKEKLKGVYEVLEPEALFQAFCSEIEKRIVPNAWQEYRKWTELMLGIFNELGESRGFIVQREWMRLDQTWVTKGSDRSFIALALEHENTENITVLLEDEIQKLLDVKAYLKVLIYYPGFLDIEGHLHRLQTKIKSQTIMIPDEQLLVIVVHPQFVKRKGFLISGYVFKANGEYTELDNYVYRV